jgi:hypothetical protein
MSRTGLPPDTQPRIGLAIQHAHSRAHLLPRLRAAVGEEWASQLLVVADMTLRSPWETYQRCLLDAAQPKLTHLLVIQDDALPVADFHERTLAAVQERPGELLCLYVPALPSYMGRAMLVAQQKGEAFASIPGGMFTPLVAAVWPVALALECAAWAASSESSRVRRCDDAQVARFLRTKRYRPLGTVPSLVEHDEATPSTLGLGRYKRTAAILG